MLLLWARACTGSGLQTGSNSGPWAGLDYGAVNNAPGAGFTYYGWIKEDPALFDRSYPLFQMGDAWGHGIVMFRAHESDEGTNTASFQGTKQIVVARGSQGKLNYVINPFYTELTTTPTPCVLCRHYLTDRGFQDEVFVGMAPDNTLVEGQWNFFALTFTLDGTYKLYTGSGGPSISMVWQFEGPTPAATFSFNGNVRALGFDNCHYCQEFRAADHFGYDSEVKHGKVRPTESKK